MRRYRRPPPDRGRPLFVLGLLESAVAYVLVAGVATASRAAGLRLPPPLDRQYVTVAVLVGVTTSVLLGRRHERRRQDRRAAGTYTGAAMWPAVALLVVLARFAIMLVGWGADGE